MKKDEIRKHEWEVQDHHLSDRVIYLCRHCGEVKIETTEKVSYAEGGKLPKSCKVRKIKDGGFRMKKQEEIQKEKNYRLIWFTESSMYKIWKFNSPEWEDWGAELIFTEGAPVHIRFKSIEDVHKVAELAGIQNYSIWEEIGTDWQTDKRVFITKDLDTVQKMIANLK